MGCVSIWRWVPFKFGEALADRGLVLNLLTHVEGWTFNSPTRNIVGASSWGIFYIVECGPEGISKRPGSICISNSFELRIVGSRRGELLAGRVSLLFSSCR